MLGKLIGVSGEFTSITVLPMKYFVLNYVYAERDVWEDFPKAMGNVESYTLEGCIKSEENLFSHFK